MILFIFLAIISICINVTTSFLSSVYSTSITGTLICRYRKAKSAFVEISENSKRLYENNPVDYTFANFGHSFYLVGKVKRIRKPHFFLKIFHQCSRRRTLQQMVFIKEIPGNLIGRNKALLELVNIGRLELSDLQRDQAFFNRKNESIYKKFFYKKGSIN